MGGSCLGGVGVPPRHPWFLKGLRLCQQGAPAQRGVGLPFLTRPFVCMWLLQVLFRRKLALVRLKLFSSLPFKLVCGVCCYMELIFSVVGFINPFFYGLRSGVVQGRLRNLKEGTVVSLGHFDASLCMSVAYFLFTCQFSN